jgi:hypothetical protein
MTILDATPLRLQLADRTGTYERNYWRWVDDQVLASKTQRPYVPRIPRHLELGLDGTHRIVQAYRQPWWRRRTPWKEAFFFLLFVIVLIAAIHWAGGRLEFGV